MTVVALNLIAILLFCAMIALCMLPDLGRVMARIFAVLALGFGIAMSVAGILFWVSDSAESVRGGVGPQALIAIGVGCVTSGVMALILSFVGRRRPAAG